MGNQISRLPTGSPNDPVGNDAGTLVRALSYAAGPVGRLADNAYTTLGELDRWAVDTVSLYAKLLKETIGLAVDVYGDKPGSGRAPMARAWDERFHRMARAHNDYSRQHPAGATPQFNALARWFAKIDPMKRMCLDHYILGRGADLVLALGQMKAMATMIDLFETTAYSPNMTTPIEQAKKGQTVSVDTQVSGQNDALGNFPVRVLGTLKAASGPASGATTSPYGTHTPADPGAPLLFEGTMSWTDYWDFDTKMSASGTGRPVKAEFQVAAVGALVDGLPFRVTSASVPMKQFSGRFPVY